MNPVAHLTPFTTLHEQVRHQALTRPGGAAFVMPGHRSTWQEYDELADHWAALLVGLGLEVGDRVGIQLPDSTAVHAALVATARAGLVAVGIGQRAGDRETAYLLRKTGARVLLTDPRHRDEPSADRVARLGDRGVEVEHHLQVQDDGTTEVRAVATGLRVEPELASTAEVAVRSLGPDDLCLLNSTSGTTGLPKCVTQFDRRWFAFSELAVAAGSLGPDEVFLGAVPAPFGFGQWTSHYAPAILGAPTVVLPKFETDAMIRLIEREQVTVLCCVSTQFRMLLNSPAARDADLSSLRVMFTGGEAVPPDRAAEFEERTGATVLQFFGSNETGALSCTTLDDPVDKRLTTAGRPIPQMALRLFDEQGRDVTATGGPGQPAGRGPLACRGYHEDDAANSDLFTPDGWMLMGDVVELDDDGYLRVVGRASDIVIRGGKNISAAQVEHEVETHPAVDLVAVVAVPDEVFGERVCAVVTLRPGVVTLELADLVAHLRQRGTSSELFPERLIVVAELPRASGGKIAKGQVVEIATATPIA